MEHNGFSGGIFPGMNSAMLGLEMPLHQQQQQNQNQNQHPPSSHQLHHPQILPYDHQHLQPQQTAKFSYSYPSSLKPKPQSPLSDEDEPSFNVEESTSDGKRKAAAMSPWQRMKWTDNMVRLLIMAVYYIGDEAGSDPIDPAGKKKPGVGLSQKKGKWKSISRAMMEKGFYVSPQQCEDKFNDLNKRYKRVNDILGKGTACKVVENQSLLESMDLTPKMKEEVKKLLNSKHLFFREMCAYHNSCGQNSPAVAPVNDQSLTQQMCSHSPEKTPHFSAEGPNSNSAKRVPLDEGDEEEEHEDGEDSDEDDSEEEDEDHDEDYHNRKPAGKRQRTAPAVMQQFTSEVMSVMEDGGKSQWEKKHWMRVRLLQLEEQQVRYQCQAFELEKQRLKWVKFSGKKEREMERSKLENERRRLENERMVLLVRQKELELIDLQQIQHQQQQFSSNKRGDPSSITG